MHITTQLSALCALLHYATPSLALEHNTIYGPSDTSGYMFYDATDECKHTAEPCITNFKHCSNLESDATWSYACPAGAKLDPSSSWIYLTGTQVFWWADTISQPIPMFDTTRMAVSNYTLKWTNTNPKYNTTLFLIPERARWTDYDLDSFFQRRVRLQLVIPAGKTEYSFQFNDLLGEMKPSFVGLNLSSFEYGNFLDEVKASMLSAWNVVFAIGQPDDPKYLKEGIVDLGNYDDNVTAKSSPFRWSTPLVRDFITTKEMDAEAMRKALKKKEHKWQLGVGVGVGVGFPVVAGVMFFLGVLLGKKSEKKNGANINLVDVPKPPEY